MWNIVKKEMTEFFSVSAKGAALKGNNGITDSYIYTAELKDLKKGAAYEYRTRTGNTVSGWMDFRTDDGGAFKAVIYPDSQSADYTGWSKLAAKAYELNKDAAFFVSMGDLVDNGQDEYQWQAWMRSMKGIMDTIPGAVMMGNHGFFSEISFTECESTWCDTEGNRCDHHPCSILCRMAKWMGRIQSGKGSLGCG